MKRTIALIVGIILIGFGAYIIFLEFQANINIADVLPDQPLFVGRIVDMAQKLEDLKESALARELKGINVSTILRQLEADPRQILYVENFQEKILTDETRQLFNQLFGREVALAAYPPVKDDWTPQTLEQWPQYFYFVTRLPGRAHMMEYMGQLFAQFEDDITQETVLYKNHKIYLIQNKDSHVPVAFTRLGNLIVLGLGQKAARDCIDVYKKDRRSLSQDPEYISLSNNFLDKNEAEFFCNLGMLGAKVKGMLLNMFATSKKWAHLGNEKFKQNMDQLFGVTYVGCSMTFEEVLRLKGDLYYSKEAFGPRWSSLLENAPQKNPSLGLISKDVKAYLWSNCYDFKSVWQEMNEGKALAQKGDAAQPTFKQLLSIFENNVGLDIEEDILSLLGREVAYAFWDVKVQGIVPIPGLLFTLKVTDTQKTLDVMKKLVESQKVFRLDVDNYLDYPIHYINVPLISDLEPAYAVIDSYLLISPKREILKKAIDTKVTPTNSLRAHPQFSDARFGLQEPGNALLFLQLPQMVKEIEVVSNWMNQRLDKEQAKQKAFRKGQEKYLADIHDRLKQQQEELEKTKTELKAREPQRLELMALEEQQTTVLEKIREMQVSIPKEDLIYNEQWKELRARVGRLRVQKAKMDFIDELDLLAKRKDALEKEIAATQEKADEIRATIDQFDQSEPVVSRGQRVFWKYVMDPLLKSFGQVDFLIGKTLFGDEMIETYFYWKLK